MKECIVAQPQKAATSTFTPVRGGVLQRKCAWSQHTTAGGECAECRAKRLGLQRRTSNQAESITAPPIVHEVLRSPGQPLDATTRTFMESRFGHDFSQVRVHTDARAADAALAVYARAFTLDSDIVFGNGEHAPSKASGRRLLAHELTHVVQQRGMSNIGSHEGLQVSTPDQAQEREARDFSEAYVNTSYPVVQPVSRGRTTRAVIQRDVFDAAVEGVWSAAGISPFAPLDMIFDGVVVSNIAVAAAISIPPDWKFKVLQYSRTNILDGVMLLPALARFPDFHRGSWIMNLQPAAAAMTLDRNIFVSGLLSLSTFVHELVHVTQYGILGEILFLVSYFGASAAEIARRWLMRQPLNPMRSSPHEAQAYALAARFDRWHTTTYGVSASSLRV